MVLSDEPLLEIDDIQGHILVGFRGAFQVLLGLRLDPASIGPARAALLPWIERVTSTREALAFRQAAKEAEAEGAAPPDQDAVLVAMALTAGGMMRLGVSDLPEDPDFRAGAARSAATLSDAVDPVTGRPLEWVYGDLPERVPDLLVIFGGGQEAAVRSVAEALQSDLDGLAEVTLRDSGARLAQEKEHFGFVDGISQTAPRGRVSEDMPLVHRTLPEADPIGARYARPGRPLVWPGQYLFGQPMQRADSLGPGQVASGGAPGLRNGSLLVLRRLRQDVAAFRTAMAELAERLTDQGIAVEPTRAAAWCVGRWPDGTPLVLAPDAPDPSIGGAVYRRNGFLFTQALGAQELRLPDGTDFSFAGAPADRAGHACPLFAHIRQVNPRDDPVDFGGAGVTLQAQMLRRGIPYGPPWPGQDDGADRGLLFMAYQTSIGNQFHRLMKGWVNGNTAPLPRSGIDPVIGADRDGGRALVREEPDGRSARHLLRGTWVRATGAVYAFAPGIGRLRQIIAGRIN